MKPATLAGADSAPLATLMAGAAAGIFAPYRVFTGVAHASAARTAG